MYTIKSGSCLFHPDLRTVVTVLGVSCGSVVSLSAVSTLFPSSSSPSLISTCLSSFTSFSPLIVSSKTMSQLWITFCLHVLKSRYPFQFSEYPRKCTFQFSGRVLSLIIHDMSIGSTTKYPQMSNLWFLSSEGFERSVTLCSCGWRSIPEVNGFEAFCYSVLLWTGELMYYSIFLEIAFKLQWRLLSPIIAPKGFKSFSRWFFCHNLPFSECLKKHQTFASNIHPRKPGMIVYELDEIHQS